MKMEELLTGNARKAGARDGQSHEVLPFVIMRAKGGDVMDVDVIMQAISNVGFPIVAFCLMWYLCNTTIKENTQAITELRITMDDIKKDGDT